MFLVCNGAERRPLGERSSPQEPAGTEEESATRLQSGMKPNAPMQKGWRSSLDSATLLQGTAEAKEGKFVSLGHSLTTKRPRPPRSPLSTSCWKKETPLPGAPPVELIQLRGVQQLRDTICVGIFSLNPKLMEIQGVSPSSALPTALPGSSWHCPEGATSPVGWL